MRGPMSKELTMHFENLIYLPMLLIVLNRDRGLIDQMGFKLKRPYLEVVDHAIKIVEKEFMATRIYMKKQSCKMLEGKKDDLFTEYIFYYHGYEDHRKYLHYQMRNRTEELMSVYLSLAMPLENPQP